MNGRVVRTMIAMLILVSLTVGGLWPAAAQQPTGSQSASSQVPVPGSASALRDSEGFEAGEVVVAYKDDTPSASVLSLQMEYNATRVRSPYGGGAELWLVPEGSERAIVKQLNADPLVKYAEPNYLYHAFGVPNDPNWSKQWAHTRIQSSAAWDIVTGSPGLTIAIIDTGIDENHPDLQGKIVAGYDFVGDDNDPHDEHGHGTHCSGIAAAATNNGIGVAGVDWQARIMPIQVLDREGVGLSWNIGQGIRWAYQHGAKVLSLSLGGPDDAQYMQEAINEAHAAGSLVVAAMGNYRQEGNPTMYPAAFGNVLAVAATGPTDLYAYYSQYGPHCDISAPGGDMSYYHDPAGIYSTMPTYPVYMTDHSYYTNYDFVQGTSQAAPHVAGLAGLIWAAAPTLTPDQVQGVIEATAEDLGAPGWDPDYGYGRINALAALRAVSIPAAPTLLPIGNADGDGAYLVDWNDVASATSYTLEEDDQPAFPSPTVRHTGSESQFAIAGQPPGTWYYRVSASNETGSSPVSNVESTIVLPAAPVLDPISNSGGGDEYLLSWSSSVGATGYVLEEADNPSFANSRTRYLGTALQYQVTGQPGGSWYYRVAAYNSAGDGPWSNTRSTAVQAAALNAPALREIDNADGDGSYLVKWTKVTGATSYRLEESPDPYFGDPNEVYSGPNLRFSVAGQSGGTWHYRVRAFGPGGSSPWGNEQSTAVGMRIYLPSVTKMHFAGNPTGGLQNGDFEGGPSAWTEQSSNEWPLIISSGFPEYVTPHSGSWAAWLGGGANEISSLGQQVIVPADKPYLAYWHWIDSDDVCGFGGFHFDAASVVVDSSEVEVYDLCDERDTGDWQRHLVDLSAYSGQSVSLQLRVETDQTFNSNLFVDDVSFQTGSLSEQESLSDATGADSLTTKPDQTAERRAQRKPYEPRSLRP